MSWLQNGYELFIPIFYNENYIKQTQTVRNISHRVILL